MTTPEPFAPTPAPVVAYATQMAKHHGQPWVVFGLPHLTRLHGQGYRFAACSKADWPGYEQHGCVQLKVVSVPRGAKVYDHDGLAGCVARRISRATGTLVGVYHAAQAGMEDEPSIPWMTVCEVHSTFVRHPTLAVAMACNDPREWCDDCRATHA